MMKLQGPNEVSLADALFGTGSLISCTLHPREMPLPSWMLKAWLPHDTECLNCHGPLEEHLVGGVRSVRRSVWERLSDDPGRSFVAHPRDLHAAITAHHHRMGDARFPLNVDRPAVAAASAFGTL